MAKIETWNRVKEIVAYFPEELPEDPARQGEYLIKDHYPNEQTISCVGLSGRKVFFEYERAKIGYGRNLRKLEVHRSDGLVYRVTERSVCSEIPREDGDLKIVRNWKVMAGDILMLQGMRVNTLQGSVNYTRGGLGLIREATASPDLNVRFPQEVGLRYKEVGGIYIPWQDSYSFYLGLAVEAANLQRLDQLLHS